MMLSKESFLRIWSSVRRKHLFPELPLPELVEGAGKVAMEIKSKRMRMDISFCERMASRLPEEEVVEALMDHGVAHHTCCPWDFSTYLKLYAQAKKVLRDPKMARRAVGYFTDVVADTYCVRRGDTKLPQLYRHMERGEVEETLVSLYQEIWGMDLGASGHGDVVRRLSRIPYLDRKKWEENVRRFARAIKPLLEEAEDEENPMGEHGPSDFSSEEIGQGLRMLASQGLDSFREIVQDLGEELLAAGGMGRGRGNPVDVDVLFYMKLAEGYALPVQKVPMEKSGSLYPYSHSPWEVGKPIKDLDIWTSFGKLLPGVSQIWERREGEVFGSSEGTPDCIVVIDSSGSMTDPRKRLSYAVLGAACAADAYLRNGAQVAVYNFSDALRGGMEVLPFSSERGAIYRTICRYFGGGTALDLRALESLRTDDPDIFLITDMQITNLRKVVDYLKGVRSRVTVVHIGENRHVQEFKERTEESGHISVYPVERQEDIPKIVLGKVREYLR